MTALSDDYDYSIRCVYVYPERQPVKKGRLRAYFKGGGATAYSRLIAAIKIGRPLKASECVHHVNGDPTDDRFENLQVLGIGEHMSLHARERWDSPRLCSSCGCDVSERTYGCQPCAVRHNKWRERGKPYVPAHTLRIDNKEYAR